VNDLTLRAVEGGVELRLRVAPGARVERIAGVHGGALNVAVQAPPEKGRANDRVVELLAEALGLAPRALVVVAGATAKDKVVRIQGLDAATVRARLTAAHCP
jgi:uncharacterized protein (TIGR00251 family)